MYRLTTLALTIAVLSFVGCADKTSDDPWANALNSYEENPSVKTATPVFDHIEPDPWRQSTDINLEERMMRAYEIAEEQGLKDRARAYLRALILSNKSASQRQVYLKKLSDLYDENTNEHQIAYYIDLAMSKNDGSLDSSINRIGRNLYDSSKHRMDEQKARQFLDACEAYALTHPSDNKSARYLHSAAETARSLEQFDRSLFYYQWVYNAYPESDKRPLALFLTGFTYDDDLGQMDSAGKYYEAFIEKYPDHELTDDAQFLLDNLGKSEDEILKTLEKGKKK